MEAQGFSLISSLLIKLSVYLFQALDWTIVRLRCNSPSFCSTVFLALQQWLARSYLNCMRTHLWLWRQLHWLLRFQRAYSQEKHSCCAPQSALAVSYRWLPCVGSGSEQCAPRLSKASVPPCLMIDHTRHRTQMEPDQYGHSRRSRQCHQIDLYWWGCCAWYDCGATCHSLPGCDAKCWSYSVGSWLLHYSLVWVGFLLGPSKR